MQYQWLCTSLFPNVMDLVGEKDIFDIIKRFRGDFMSTAGDINFLHKVL